MQENYTGECLDSGKKCEKARQLSLFERNDRIFCKDYDIKAYWEDFERYWVLNLIPAVLYKMKKLVLFLQKQH